MSDPTPVAEVGTGPDTLALRVSGTAYEGIRPQFAVSVNGQPVEGVFTANAEYGQASDTILLHGTWGPSATVSIDYLNDGFNPNLDWSNPAVAMAGYGHDRNLFVDGLKYNGVNVVGGAQAIWNDSYEAGPISTKGDARAGTGAFDVLDQAKAADPNFDVDQYLAAGGFSNFDVNSYLAGGDGVSTGGPAAPVPVSSDGFDFNGARWKIQHVEDFGNPQTITNLWGNTQIGPGGVTVSSLSDGAFSGAMGHAGNAANGFGYGLYILATKLTVEGMDSGPYVCLWPGTDEWPGPEVDLLEFLPGTDTGYGTLHWKGTDGSNQFKSVIYEGIEFNGQPHFTWVDWQPGSITFGVDDKAFATFTDHVPVAYADGGENLLPGIGTKFEGTANAAEMMGLVYATRTDDPSGVSLGALTDQPLV